MNDYKKLTIFLFPEKTEKVYQFRLPGIFISLVVSFLLFFGAGFSLLIGDYRLMKAKVPLLYQLERDHDRLGEQFLLLAGRVFRMKQETKTLKKRRPRPQLKEISQTGEISRPLGLGGSGQSFIGADYGSTAETSNLIRLIHRSLEDLDEEIHTFELAGNQKETFGPNSEKTGMEGPGNRKTESDPIREELMTTAKDMGLDPRLALGMAKVESGFDPTLISPKGAIGVLQVMPQFVLKEHGITRDMLFDPEVNIRVGLSRMKALLDRFDQDLDLSLAAYNAGASRVVKAGYTIPSIGETRAYVRKVKEAMKYRYLRLYASN